MAKTYNTPKRNHIVKTRLDDEEHADFLRRLEIYDMNQSEFIREAISGATIKPTIVATLVSDDTLIPRDSRSCRATRHYRRKWNSSSRRKTSFITSTRLPKTKHSGLTPFATISNRLLAEKLNTKKNRSDKAWKI